MNTVAAAKGAKFSNLVLDIIAKANTLVAEMNEGEMKLRDRRWEMGETLHELRNAIEKYHKNDDGLTYNVAQKLITFTKLISPQTSNNYREEVAICKEHGISKELYFAVGINTLRAARFNPEGRPSAASVIKTWASPVTEGQIEKLLEDYPQLSPPTLGDLLERFHVIQEAIAERPSDFASLLTEAGTLQKLIQGEKERFVKQVNEVAGVFAGIVKFGGDIAFAKQQLQKIIANAPPQMLEGRTISPKTK